MNIATRRNGCFNRAPLKAHRGRDGYWCDGETLTIKAVTIPQTMARDCQYTHSELGMKDKGCDGCKHSKNEMTTKGVA